MNEPAMTIPEQAGPLQVEIAEQIARDASCAQGEFGQRVLSIIPYLTDVCDRASLVGVERAALPPLRAREEIARAIREALTPAYEEREEPTDADHLKAADAVLALSHTAGQEWRDINSAKKVYAHEIAMTLCEVDGHDPDDEAPLTEMCDDANMPVPWWMVYVEYAEALLDKFTILPAPPVAEPIVADKQTLGAK
jgi:hypothetical protein